jgi:hypothetical protein
MALAAAPEVVSQFTSPTAKPSEEVRLEAAINPENEATKCDFQYGETVVSEHEAACTEPAGGIAEGGEQRAAVTVTGLKAGTTYHWRVVLKNASGKIEGNPEEVTSLPVPSTEAPSLVGSTTATFHGKLTPLNENVATEYFFYYHLNAELVCLPESETQPHESAGTGSGVADVETAVTGLEPNHEYTVCLADTNLFGGVEVDLKSPPIHFKTEPAAPEVSGESASPITTSAATLNAAVNPNNEKTTYFFEYSTSEAEVLASKGTKLAGAPPAAELENFGFQGVSVPTGVLHADTTYFYRVIAKNVTGEEEGTVEHFITNPETPEGLKAEPITESTATLNGVLNPKATLAGEPETYEFIYRQAIVGCQGPGEARTMPEIGAGGKGEAAKPAELTGLPPGETYTFCLRVVNGAGVEALSAPVTFTTLAVPPAIELGKRVRHGSRGHERDARREAQPRRR